MGPSFIAAFFEACGGITTCVRSPSLLRLLRGTGLALGFECLSACHSGLLMTVGPEYQTPEVKFADHWNDGRSLVAHRGNRHSLARWWDRFGDPTLSHFLADAQNVSASIAEANSRIVQARASVAGALTASLPTLDGKLDANWSSFTFGGPTFDWTRYQAGIQSSWELDLFGGLARQREAAKAQLESRTAAWHDARVAVAVETADAYLGYRHCEVLMRIAEADAASRSQSAHLTEITGRAGMRSPADVALARASAADGQELQMRQRAQCEHSVKGLVALTGLMEDQVRRLLAAGAVAEMPEPPPFTLPGLPANLLLQRPDVAATERDVAEASATIGVEQAKRFPKLSLSGNITPTLQSANASALLYAQTWQVGPTLSLPLFDAGKRAADVDAAIAQYEAAVSRFRATVRRAAKEVEDALIRLQSAAERLPQAQTAAEGYRANFLAMEKLYRVGFGSLIDTEASRRQALSAERVVAELKHERAAAWIALYRAAGGGWESASPPAEGVAATERQTASAPSVNPQTPFP